MVGRCERGGYHEQQFRRSDVFISVSFLRHFGVSSESAVFCACLQHKMGHSARSQFPNARFGKEREGGRGGGAGGRDQRGNCWEVVDVLGLILMANGVV